MNMLTDRDIKRIGEEMGKVLEQNVMPQFEEVYSRLDKIEGRMNSEMVTKTYLDDKLADLRGEFFLKFRSA